MILTMLTMFQKPVSFKVKCISVLKLSNICGSLQRDLCRTKTGLKKKNMEKLRPILFYGFCALSKIAVY